jgi:hypothetical protein
LHWLVLTRKALTTLEFGSGFSTLAIADAKRRLRRHFGDWAKKYARAQRPFHVYAVEEDIRFREITQSRLNADLEAYATVVHSSVELTLHEGRIATVYSSVPNVSPDLIYLDGPSQFATTATINGFHIADAARMPMSADILRFEFFLEPGTLIVVDGRTANARFLKAYLRRDWAYAHMPTADIHLFELQEGERRHGALVVGDLRGSDCVGPALNQATVLAAPLR